MADIIKTIGKLKSHSSPGPDNVTSYFLKKVRAHIASPLTRLFNVSLNDNSVPSDWKKAIVVLIFKKKDPQCAANYRPVSLTSVLWFVKYWKGS